MLIIFDKKGRLIAGLALIITTVILSIAKNLVRFAYRLYKILRYAQNDRLERVA